MNSGFLNSRVFAWCHKLILYIFWHLMLVKIVSFQKYAFLYLYKSVFSSSRNIKQTLSYTGKSVSKALILELPQNMTRDCSLFSKKNTSSQHVVYKNCFLCFCFDIQNNMLWTCIFLGIQWAISRYIVG